MVETYIFVPEPLWNSDNQKLSNFKIDFFYRSVILLFSTQFYYFYYHLVLITQHKILVLALPDTSSNLHNQALLLQSSAFYTYRTLISQI